MRGTQRFEYATAQDPALNYCLWPYRRPEASEDKFRSVNLLLQSFDLAGVGERAYALIDAVRDAIGPFKTVFGIKLHEARLFWEFYFYDYARTEREVSISRMIEALAPFAPCRVQPNERLPYFMFSVDIDDELARGARELDVVHMYVGNAGSTVSSGIAYALEPRNSATLENFYFFFDAGTQREQAAAKIASSAYFDPGRMRMEQALIPELVGCETICVANKRTHDCVYFSGIDVVQLAWFLERFGYPEAIQRFVREHRSMLGHLLFDVGIDYRLQEDGVAYLKSGYYGVF
jgi:hypothetical protein